MSPKTEEAVFSQEEPSVPEITEDGFPEWHSLAREAMEEAKVGDVEPWP